MDPIAIVTAFVGVLYIVGRGGHVVAPAATVAYYRRLSSSPKRIRFSGILLLAFVALPLIVTARQARADKGEITIWIEGFGWIVTALMILFIAVPGWWCRFCELILGCKPGSALDTQPTQSVLRVLPLLGRFLCTMIRVLTNRVVAKQKPQPPKWETKKNAG